MKMGDGLVSAGLWALGDWPVTESAAQATKPLKKIKMNSNFNARHAPRPWAAVAGVLASAALGLLPGSAFSAEPMYHQPSLGAGGGVPAQAEITSTIITPTNATLSWYGMQGFYTVEMSTNLPNWIAVGSVSASSHAASATVPNPTGSTDGVFYRLNQANGYEGSGGCAGCHGDKFAQFAKTAHATAHSAIANIGMGENPNCTACHTVGKGQPTGFVSSLLTPHLKNVGCESCHGPAGWHKYSDHDLIRPAVSQDPQICGSCHQDSHHPTYEEYESSAHSHVNIDIKYGTALLGAYFPETINVLGTNWYGYYVTTNANGTLKTNRTTGIYHSNNGPIPGVNYLYDPGQDRATSCGVCHSAATRMALLKDYDARIKGYTNALDMPVASDSGAWTATCVTCHDPHSNATNRVAQLRHPLGSTNYYTMPTGQEKRTYYTTNFQGRITTNVAWIGTTFANMYNPNVQVCGQCHNSRGARWDGLAYGARPDGTFGVTTNVTGYSRPPHHSPQYNMLIGIVQDGYISTNVFGAPTNIVGNHGRWDRNPNQCSSCHVASYAVSSTTNVTGHTFHVDKRGCNNAGCHLSGIPDVHGWMEANEHRVESVVDLLKQWSTNVGPVLLGTTDYNKHQENTWEFSTVGELATGTLPGPAATNQVKLPESIRQARFNLYMVAYDGSWGVHNTRLTPLLIRDAETKVLNQLSIAKFNVANAFVWTNVYVLFTNLNPAVTSWTWDYGDGTTDSGIPGIFSTNRHLYTAPGTYTVKLTATDPLGTETLVRTNLVVVYNKPAPSFTMTPNTGTAPLTVNFSNTSTDATYYRWNFISTNTVLYSNEENPAFTYTNAGTYALTLRAYNEGGSVTVTSNITVAAP
jgi:hypothetical protein